MLGTFQSLALIHNKLKFHMYARTLLTQSYAHSAAIFAESYR